MTRLAISVEGQTEEDFAKDLLAAHLQSWGVDVKPILIGRARGKGQGGGNVSIGLLAKELQALRPNFDAVTSLVDFYGFRGKGAMLPDDLLQAIRESIGRYDERFVFPYVQMHEFEGLLFSNVNAFERVFLDPPIADLRSIRSAFDTPEDINDSSATAPSKRIKKLIPSYRKRLDGPLLAVEIGLDGIRSQCPRFDAWLRRLESLGEPAT
ncbi:DUF4276 family protein [Candidatus Palauibacter sp.]|uniref:DUF4276 family protein n=1 Tax=Candidatus Palauibacter sp. TaxID=3101350 RepID=UPI003B0108D8